MNRPPPIRELAQDLEHRLIACIPTLEEAAALRSLRNEINVRLLALPPRDSTPGYAVGIDHGTDPSATVVAQIEAETITLVDEPGDVDDGPRVKVRYGPHVTHMTKQALRRYGELIRRMDTKPPLIDGSVWRCKCPSCAADEGGIVLPGSPPPVLTRHLTYKAASDPTKWFGGSKVTDVTDDELDEEERGEWTAWSSTWDG